MKYEIEGIKKEETIKGYRILNNSIIVTYLDDSLKTFPYTKDNEAVIVNEMLKQAKYRESKLYSAYMSNKIGKAYSDDAFAFSLFSISAVSSVAVTYLIASTTNSSPASIVALAVTFGIVDVITLRTSIDASKNQKKISKELADVEKYHIYLEIKDAIEHLPKSELYELYNGIKSKASTLNINTIDEFSLKDLKKISDNLRLINASKIECQPENFTYEPESFENYTEPSPEEYVGRFSKPRK